MSGLLLDTHVVLWWLADDPRLTEHLRDSITRSGAVHVSSASTWEVAIKTTIGKLDIALEPDTSFPSVCASQGFRLTAVEHEDAWAVLELPPSRADPFDRLIAATARRRNWTVVSVDPVFRQLGVSVLGP